MDRRRWIRTAMRIRGAAVLATIAVAIVPTIALASTSQQRSSPLQREFRVAAPLLFPAIGPVLTGRYPACRPGDLRRTAHTQLTPDGVVGVVHLHYRKHHRCSLHVRRSPTALLGATGHRIAVPVRGPADIDSGETIRPDLALHEGNAVWGFAWRGSWCGRAARYVRMKLRSGARLNVPLTGPSPGCEGTSHSVVLRGLVGGAGTAVQTAPPEWSGLTASIEPPGTTDGQYLTGARLALTNPTATPIPFDPCPAYSISVEYRQRNSGGTTSNAGSALRGCTGAQSIRPGQTLTFGLKRMQYAFVHNHAKSGTSLTVTVAIAGLPRATAQVPVP